MAFYLINHFGKRIAFDERAQTNFRFILQYMYSFDWRVKLWQSALSLFSPRHIKRLSVPCDPAVDLFGGDEAVLDLLNGEFGFHGSDLENTFLLFPAQPHRKRFYIFSFESTGRCTLFAKVAFSADDFRSVELDGEKTRSMFVGNFRTFAVPQVLRIRRCNESIGFVEYEPLPQESRQGTSGWNKTYARIWQEIVLVNQESLDVANICSSAKQSDDAWWDQVFDIAVHTEEHSVALCTMSHGDFAPWNVRFTSGKPLLFDWENSAESRPVLFDPLDFFIKVRKLLRKHAEDDIGHALYEFAQHLKPFGNSALNVLLALRILSDETTLNSSTTILRVAQSYWNTVRQKS